VNPPAAAALRAIHGRLDEQWMVQRLSEIAGMSRTTSCGGEHPNADQHPTADGAGTFRGHLFRRAVLGPPHHPGVRALFHGRAIVA
jgi:hypothetical protein